MSFRRTNNIEALSEWLESLQITDEILEETNRQIDTEMSVAPAIINKNVQASMLKSIVLDLGWFDGDWTKFEDWWRRIWLFLKSNRVIETDNRNMAILACLRGSVVDIHIEKAQWARQQTGNPRLGRFHKRNQNNV